METEHRWQRGTDPQDSESLEASGSICQPIVCYFSDDGTLVLLPQSQEVLHAGGKLFSATFHGVLSGWELALIHNPRGGSLERRGHPAARHRISWHPWETFLSYSPHKDLRKPGQDPVTKTAQAQDNVLCESWVMSDRSWSSDLFALTSTDKCPGVSGSVGKPIRMSVTRGQARCLEERTLQMSPHG